MVPKKKSTHVWHVPQSNTWGRLINPLIQEEQLITIKNRQRPFWERKYKCYSNFHFIMETRYGKNDRVDAYNTIPKHLVYYEPTIVTRVDSWTNMADYAFVLSPYGNGLDCHRTWEALCLGCIPVVKTSGLDPLFEDLPVWIVNSWKYVTQENMINKINEFRKRTFKYERLELNYWRQQINSKRRARTESSI
jgi:hypothetical protein